jgi:hypothetical protein
MIIAAQTTSKEEEQELRFITNMLVLKERVRCLVLQENTTEVKL